MLPFSFDDYVVVSAISLYDYTQVYLICFPIHWLHSLFSNIMFIGNLHSVEAVVSYHTYELVIFVIINIKHHSKIATHTPHKIFLHSRSGTPITPALGAGRGREKIRR